MMPPLKLFQLQLAALFAFAKTTFRAQLVYRIANWSGMFTNLFFLFIKVGVFLAFYRDREAVAGLQLLDALTYVAVAQSLFTLMPHVGSLGLSEHIYTGQIAIEINRPINFYAIFMAKRAGIFCYYLLYRTIPILIVAALVGVLRLPQQWWQYPLFLLSVTLGAWITLSFMFLVESTAFWLESDRGAKVLNYSFVAFTSGLLIPLNFYPDWLYKTMIYLPLSHAFNSPSQIFVGVETFESLVHLMSLQVTWALALSGLCLMTLRQAVLKVVVNGG